MAELPNSFHTHQSWGRTRSPKNILSTNRAGIDAAGATHANITDGNFSSDCITENQRYLHITHEATGGAGTLEVWGYMHATGIWSQVGSSVTTGTSTQHTIVEIAGIDKIKIKAVTRTLVKLWLACSTF